MMRTVERVERTEGKNAEWTMGFLAVAPARQVTIDGKPAVELTTRRGVFRAAQDETFKIPDDHGFQRYTVRTIAPEAVTVEYESLYRHHSFGKPLTTIDVGSVSLPTDLGPEPSGDGAPPSPASDTGSATVLPTGVHELDVEVLSFHDPNKRRQTWIFGLRRLDTLEKFHLELVGSDGFVKSFLATNPDLLKAYWREREVAIRKNQNWGYAKKVSPHPRYHIKVEAYPRMAKILEWKRIDSKRTKGGSRAAE
jgi:hypothetical protein